VWLRAWRAIVGLFWAIAYLFLFALRAGIRAEDATVDLTRRPPTAAHARGHAVLSRVFSLEQTAQIVARAKERGLSFAASFTADVAQALFDVQPERARV